MLAPTKTANLVRLGFAVLCFATLVHAVEHWEVAIFENCLAACDHAHASSQQDAPSHVGHHHACSPHDHSPAILQAPQADFTLSTAIALIEAKSIPPPSITWEIDQPPRIS